MIGLVSASALVGRSRVWLRKKLELGELTGYQTGRGGNWQVDPEILVKELKGCFKSSGGSCKENQESRKIKFTEASQQC